MYCSSCGVAVTKGLSFCNYCGARIPSTESNLEFREVRPGLLISAMAGVFILGLPGVTFLVFMLRAAGLDSGQISGFAWTGIFLLMALEVVFLMLLVRRKPRDVEAVKTDQLKGPRTKELEEKHPGMLPEPVPSVTEHTTRAFDSIPRERS